MHFARRRRRREPASRAITVAPQHTDVGEGLPVGPANRGETPARTGTGAGHRPRSGGDPAGKSREVPGADGGSACRWRAGRVHEPRAGPRGRTGGQARRPAGCGLAGRDPVRRRSQNARRRRILQYCDMRLAMLQHAAASSGTNPPRRARCATPPGPAPRKARPPAELSCPEHGFCLRHVIARRCRRSPVRALNDPLAGLAGRFSQNRRDPPEPRHALARTLRLPWHEAII